MTTLDMDHDQTHFDRHTPPAARVASGAEVRFRIRNPYGAIVDAGEPYRMPNRGNPIVGPVHVEGASPGDALRAEILAVRPLADHGYVMLYPNKGGFKRDWDRVHLRRVALRADGVEIARGLTAPYRWMVGKIGVAPAGEAVASGAPGRHGGNLDNRHLGPGASLYLPVRVEGALFCLGDVHAAMGDGESGVSGVETDAEVDVRLSVVPAWPHAHPIATTAATIQAMGFGATLDEAAVDALYAARHILEVHGAAAPADAALWISAAADLEVCQIVNPVAGMRVSLPRPNLPGGPYFD
jgi:amidase